MDSLRWVLLGVGVIFVLVIYLFGRNRRQRDNLNKNENEFDDLPEFSAQNLDDIDEGVGEVRVITDANPVLDDLESIHASTNEKNAEESLDERRQDAEVNSESDNKEIDIPSDMVVMYILPKPEQELLGAHINTNAQAMGLMFAEMNIFHYKDGERTVFSLANMLEPGSFDPDTIHDLRTIGLTVFMQFKGTDTLDDLNEMLQRSYKLSRLLDARLCNHKREPLTEQDAKNYRARASDFMVGDLNRSPSTV